MAEFNGRTIDLFKDNIAPSFNSWNVSGGSVSNNILTLNAGGFATVNINNIITSSQYLYFEFDTNYEIPVANNYNSLVGCEAVETYINYNDNNEEEVYKKNLRRIALTQTKNCVVETQCRDLRLKLKLFNDSEDTITFTKLKIQRSRDFSEKQISEDFSNLYDNMISQVGTFIECRLDDPPAGELYAGRIWLRDDLVTV